MVYFTTIFYLYILNLFLKLPFKYSIYTLIIFKCGMVLTLL